MHRNKENSNIIYQYRKEKQIGTISFTRGESYMKKKLIGIFIIVAVMLLFCLYGRGIEYYINYVIPNKECFGRQYCEVLHLMSFRDKQYANEIMKTVDEAFSFIGDAAVARSRYGELSRYSARGDAVSETHDLKLVTADFGSETGYLWFIYNCRAFDGNNKSVGGASDVLARLTLEKSGEAWVVVDTKEPA